MFAFAVDPLYRDIFKQLAETSLTSKEALCNYAVMYHRLFIDDDPGTTRGEMASWLEGNLKPDVDSSEFANSIVRYHDIFDEYINWQNHEPFFRNIGSICEIASR